MTRPNLEMSMQMQQEPETDKWEYIETRSAKIRATPQIELIPHWYGTQDAEDIRAVMRRAVVAVNNHDALIEALSDVVCKGCDVRVGNDSDIAKTVARNCGTCKAARAALSAAQEQSNGQA